MFNDLSTDLAAVSFNRLGHITGAGSDYAPFVHYLGITAMDISYTYDRVGTASLIYSLCDC